MEMNEERETYRYMTVKRHQALENPPVWLSLFGTKMSFFKKHNRAKIAFYTFQIPDKSHL